MLSPGGALGGNREAYRALELGGGAPTASLPEEARGRLWSLTSLLFREHPRIHPERLHEHAAGDALRDQPLVEIIEGGRLEHVPHSVDLAQVPVGEVELLVELPGVEVEVRDDLEEHHRVVDGSEAREHLLVDALRLGRLLLEEELALE